MLRALWLQLVATVCQLWLGLLHAAHDHYCRRAWRKGNAALSFELWRRR